MTDFSDICCLKKSFANRDALKFLVTVNLMWPSYTRAIHTLGIQLMLTHVVLQKTVDLSVV